MKTRLKLGSLNKRQGNMVVNHKRRTSLKRGYRAVRSYSRGLKLRKGG